MKIGANSLVMLLVCLLFTASPYLSQRNNNIIFMLIEIMLTIILINKKVCRNVIKGNYPIILFGLTMTFSTFINVGFTSRTLNAFVTGLRYVMIFVTVCQLSMEITFVRVADMLFKIIFAATTLEDIAVLVTKGKGIVNNGVQAEFFIGNKFGVSYLHLFSIALLLLHITVKKGSFGKGLSFWGYLLYSIVICRMVDCNTGIVGCLVIGIMVMLSGKKDKLIALANNQSVFLIVLVGSTFLLVGTDVILGNEYIYRLLLKYSHTNKILSGRVDMYRIAIKYIVRNPIWGYGINDTIVQDILSWGNAQNGLLKMLLDHGSVGTVAFLLVCWNAMKVTTQNEQNRVLFALMTFLYAMAICSMVEINIAGFFFAGLAMVKAFRINIKI